MRPDHLVVVTGTETGVGKTWIGAQLAADLRRSGATVVARKPVQSFEPSAGEPTDAESLAAATGEDPHAVCPSDRWYPLAMAPPVAADALGRPPFTVADLVAGLRWPADPPADYGLVESAGGPRSPLAADGDTVTLAGLLQPDHIVLVAGAGLGAINAVLLSAGAFDAPSPIVVLNRFDDADPLHVSNLEWLEAKTELCVLTSVAHLVAHLRGAERVSEDLRQHPDGHS